MEKLTYKEAAAEINGRWREVAPQIMKPAKEKANGETSYICPICGHGTHGDGLTYNKKGSHNTLKCFACGFAGSIVELRMQSEDVDFKTAVNELAGLLGLELKQWEDTMKSKQTHKQEPYTAPAATHEEMKRYIEKCQVDLNAQAAREYLESRGISYETAAAAGIGYDWQADPAGNPVGYPGKSKHPTPRIIIPTSTGYYVGKAINPIEPKYKDMNPAGGKAGLFNMQVVAASGAGECIYIVEGAVDALSLLEVGRAAVALNSVANAALLVETLEAASGVNDKIFIICMDNDSAGAKAADTLREGLQRLGLAHIVANVAGDYKDPNEALTADKEAFIAAVAEAEHQASGKPDSVAYYLDYVMGGDIESFGETIPTGFPTLDTLSGGGLYPGLYCLAAISSLGKTTFALQLADQIAAAGNDVLFFSLEQSRLELVSKSLARRTHAVNPESNITSLSIRRGYVPDSVKRAAQEYKSEVGDRLSIVDGNFNCDLTRISDYIVQYCQRNNARPVVIIDYLQILQPETDDKGRKQTSREAMDSAVTTLKQLSRKLRIPVIVISSVNRASYLMPIELESVKESGGIEYTCDVVWGLQFSCMREDLFTGSNKDGKLQEKRDRIREAKAESPRHVELVSLKNRYGKATYSCEFTYTPEYDTYAETADTAIFKTKTARKLPGRAK